MCTCIHYIPADRYSSRQSSVRLDLCVRAYIISLQIGILVGRVL